MLQLHSDLLPSIAEILMIYWRQNFTHVKLSLYMKKKANNTWKISPWTANKSFYAFYTAWQVFLFQFGVFLTFWKCGQITFSHILSRIQIQFKRTSETDFQAIQLTKSAHSDKPYTLMTIKVRVHIRNKDNAV